MLRAFHAGRDQMIRIQSFDPLGYGVIERDELPLANAW
jgi:hypothetical protein